MYRFIIFDLDIEYLTSWSSCGFASRCYEIIFAFCDGSFHYFLYLFLHTGYDLLWHCSRNSISKVLTNEKSILVLGLTNANLSQLSCATRKGSNIEECSRHNTIYVLLFTFYENTYVCGLSLRFVKKKLKAAKTGYALIITDLFR
jgi:hypothetical protein